ncbi:hypothetical protein PSHT_15242, partial [Puccinia striiformis]
PIFPATPKDVLDQIHLTLDSDHAFRPEAKQGNVPSDYSEVCEAEDRLVFHYKTMLLSFLDRGVLIEVFCISQIFLVIPANLATLNPPLPPKFSCNSKWQTFQGGFHNTCCSKDLDFRKFPQSVGFHSCDILSLEDHLATLDRGTFDKFCTDLTPIS